MIDHTKLNSVKIGSVILRKNEKLKILFFSVFFRIDMYVEGTRDLMDLIRVHHKFSSEEQEKNLALINERATARYFPVYEKVISCFKVV